MADNQLAYIYGAVFAAGEESCAQVAAYTSNGFSSWTPFSAATPIVPTSVGKVYFIVLNNSGSGTGNPTGLRVEFKSTYFRAY